MYILNLKIIKDKIGNTIPRAKKINLLLNICSGLKFDIYSEINILLSLKNVPIELASINI